MQPCGGSHGKVMALCRPIVCLLLVAGFAIPRAQSGPQLPTIRVETKQVLVPVIVKDHKGHYIRNLTSAFMTTVLRKRSWHL
jgi:hypothetical protein